MSTLVIDSKDLSKALVFRKAAFGDEVQFQEKRDSILPETVVMIGVQTRVIIISSHDSESTQ